jgi:hypothetical protein
LPAGEERDPPVLVLGSSRGPDLGGRVRRERDAVLRPGAAEERVEPESSEDGREDAGEVALATATGAPACLLDQRLLVDEGSIAELRRARRKGDAHACHLVIMTLL